MVAFKLGCVTLFFALYDGAHSFSRAYIKVPIIALRAAQEDVLDSTRRAGILSPLLVSLPVSAAVETPGFLQEYDDFVRLPNGVSYRDVNSGTGEIKAAVGDRVVFDWRYRCLKVKGLSILTRYKKWIYNRLLRKAISGQRRASRRCL